MFKQLFKENPSLKMLLVTLLILLIGLLIILYINDPQKNGGGGMSIYYSSPAESMEIGSIGNIESGKSIADVNPAALHDPVRPIDEETPKSIFNTAGTILTINENSITIRGNGTSFDDQVKRDIVIYVKENSVVNGIKGYGGLSTLSVGDQVSIESQYNIHGKIEITAKYINKI